MDEGKQYLKKGCLGDNAGYICIIGGANVDIQGFPFARFIPRDSNPGIVKVSAGGVGRNIGENIARMGCPVKLITVIGADANGRELMEHSKSSGIDMENCLVINGKPTSTYLCILDEKGDMISAIADMGIFDLMDTGFIEQKKQVIEDSRLCILDTNIPSSVIEYVVKAHKDKIFFLDTVSTSKAMKVKDCIGYFHTIKPNVLEAEALSGIEIHNEDDCYRASSYFLNKGVKRVFITMGDKGVYYNDGFERRQIKAPHINAVNATGAGDAFIAALALGYVKNFNIDYAARFAQAASVLALLNEDTINPGLSFENVIMKMEEIEKCIINIWM